LTFGEFFNQKVDKLPKKPNKFNFGI
jgi:hypothetical protein